MTKELTETQRVLLSMLNEPSNAFMWHSYNQHSDYVNEPRSKVVAEGSYVSWLHNVYHWLNDRLIYAPKLDSLFQAWSESDMKDESYYTMLHSFTDYLVDQGFEVDDNGVVNSYNSEDLLSQTIQYSVFEIVTTADDEIDESQYVVLQIHLGSDVRGNYSRPFVFEISHDNEFAINDNAAGTIYCDHCSAYWSYSDAGYYLDYAAHDENDYYNTDVPELNPLKLEVLGGLYEENSYTEDSRVWWLWMTWRRYGRIDWEKQLRLNVVEDRVLFALPNGDIVCPCCGAGILRGDFR